ncbi:MAG: hypothetical protein RLZZ387_1271 [Chloroflexota bacterium]|jgi:DNA-binding CsgD family transcriptional regulator
MPPARRRGPGRPPHEPTDESRALVVRLVGEGRPVDAIAEAVGVSEPTLRAHYDHELATAPRPQITFPFAADPTAPRPARPGAGRPPHVPTAETRERVEILVAGGMPAWHIATALGISEPTLREHYAGEMDGGRARKNADVLVALHRKAAEGNVSAARAWLGLPAELDAPPAPAPEPKAEPIGKKEAAQMAALTAADGTDWQSLLPH